MQFAHVARPAMLLQTRHRLRRQDLGRQAVRRRSLQVVVGQFGNVVEALAQRRQADRHDVEAVEQILAEEALLDLAAKVAMGRRHDSHIGLDRRATADRHVFAFLQHAQKARLRLGRHVADLVEEQRAAGGLLEQAGFFATAPVKAPRSWPNSSLSISSAGSRRS
jgi:hypothetical protein